MTVPRPSASGSVLRSSAFHRFRQAAVDRLLLARGTGGHWTGRLSSSALSTATAIACLRLVEEELGGSTHALRIAAGSAWLVATQLPDGSWGDTPQSIGNLSTTILCWSALAAVDDDQLQTGGPQISAGTLERARSWIAARAGSTTPAAIAQALSGIYGRDQTFSVPILTHACLCGRLGDPRDPATWRVIPQLPFQLAVLPQDWFRLVDLQVVSYALPALIAIGQVRHARAPGWGLSSGLRRLAVVPTLRTLGEIQPANGGFLEATPLTSFVTMSLAGMHQASHPVAVKGTAFLVASQRPDGSWPIDTNLATWCTSLSVGALSASGRLAERLGTADRGIVRDWLLNQQWKRTHPATGAAPGGWAWTDLPGGVPDADDTSGALVALAALAGADGGRPAEDVQSAANAGLTWLADLANRDGGIPTFCRGWGRLPFDTSCPDITAHFLRAAAAWGAEGRVARAVAAGQRYLRGRQRPDGSWWPLWFGNQGHPDQATPVYGTARVVLATLDTQGAEWLCAAQSASGSVTSAPGLPGTIEETAVAVEALAAVVAATTDTALQKRALQSVEAGVEWLMEQTAGGTTYPSAPIGLYFAKLWYDEQIYPLAFTVAAVERASRLSERN